ncbi:MAG TPA: FAD/NAD(P)-binding protein [Aliidongia sp.]|nr:FAD/NAD(P)-binding protein [Aliidongia sp.]
MSTIAIVGAGFSGTLLTLHLLRRCPASTRIHLIERNRRFGPGAAYSTGNASHLLNVPAGRMSAFRDRPQDFQEWLAASTPGLPSAQAAGTFVPRGLYGDYIRRLLLDEMRKPANAGRLKLSRGAVLSVEEGPTLKLHLDRDRHIEADTAVLAIGNFPPEPPPGADPAFLDSPRYQADPWAPDSLSGIDPDAPVLLIGTGLTMVDTAITLFDEGHRGPIHALSRRGLLPRRHGTGPSNAAVCQDAFPTRLSALTRYLRRESRNSVEAGGHWQAVIDSLRPFTQDVWHALSAEDRKRFLRHLRPWWEVHRHRMAPGVAERVDLALSRGQLHVHAGRIQQFCASETGVTVSYRKRKSGEAAELTVARVINCSGPGCDYDRITDPLVRSLLDCGLARPDELRLGLDVTGNCAIKHADGSISRRLFAIGPATKGEFWEMTAVPDIRRQCEFLGDFLAAQHAAAPPRAPIEVTPVAPGSSTLQAHSRISVRREEIPAS